MDSQCPGCLGQAVVTLRLPWGIVESPWCHKHIPFVNIAFLRSQSIKRCQWNNKLGYYGVVFAHLATGWGIKTTSQSPPLTRGSVSGAFRTHNPESNSEPKIAAPYDPPSLSSLWGPTIVPGDSRAAESGGLHGLVLVRPILMNP